MTELASDPTRVVVWSTGGIGRLSIVSGQVRLTVGDFLAPEERKTLASALRNALAIPRI